MFELHCVTNTKLTEMICSHSSEGSRSSDNVETEEWEGRAGISTTLMWSIFCRNHVTFIWNVDNK